MKAYILKIVTAMLAVLTLVVTVNVAQAQTNSVKFKALKLRIINNTGTTLKSDKNWEDNFDPNPFEPVVNPGSNEYTLTVTGDKTQPSQIVFYSFDPKIRDKSVKILGTVNGDDPGPVYSSCTPYPNPGSIYLCTSKAYTSTDGIYYVIITIDKKNQK